MQKEGCLMRNRKMNICYLRRKTKTACAVSVSVVREVDIRCIPSHVFKKEKNISHFSLHQKHNVVQELKADCNLSRMCSSKLQPRGTQHQQLYCGHCPCFKEFLSVFEAVHAKAL